MATEVDCNSWFVSLNRTKPSLNDNAFTHLPIMMMAMTAMVMVVMMIVFVAICSNVCLSICGCRFSLSVPISEWMNEQANDGISVFVVVVVVVGWLFGRLVRVWTVCLYIFVMGGHESQSLTTIVVAFRGWILFCSSLLHPQTTWDEEIETIQWKYSKNNGPSLNQTSGDGWGKSIEQIHVWIGLGWRGRITKSGDKNRFIWPTHLC